MLIQSTAEPRAPFDSPGARYGADLYGYSSGTVRDRCDRHWIEKSLHKTHDSISGDLYRHSRDENDPLELNKKIDHIQRTKIISHAKGRT